MLLNGLSFVLLFVPVCQLMSADGYQLFCELTNRIHHGVIYAILVFLENISGWGKIRGGGEKPYYPLITPPSKRALKFSEQKRMREKHLANSFEMQNFPNFFCLENPR